MAVAAREEVAAAEACRHNLDAYGAWVHGHRPARHHRVWLERLLALVDGTSPKRKLLVVSPPGHAKSTWISLVFPPWHLGNHPDESLLFFTSSSTMAGQFGTTVKATLEGNERHRLAFPADASHPDLARGWSLDGLYLRGTPPASKDPAYRALGYGASTIGARAHGIVLDDPLTQEQAQSAVDQVKARRYFDLTVDSRLHPGGWMLAIMTRWHELDLAAHLAAKPDWDVLEMPALAPEDAPYPWGRALWPERFPVAWLEEKRASIGGPLFNAMYQGDPTSLGGDVFREAAWFRPLPADFASLRPLLQVVQYWDLAFSEKASADHTAAVTVMVDARKEGCYVTNAMRTRLAEARLDQAMTDHILLTRPSIVGVEEGAFKQAATTDLVRRVSARCAAAGVAVAILPVKVTTDKVFRARLPAAWAEAGRLFVDRAAAWAEPFVAECLGFPNAAHDDQVDALAGAVQLAIEQAGVTARDPEPYALAGPPSAAPSDAIERFLAGRERAR